MLIIIKTFKHHKTGMNTEFYLITPINSLCLKSKILCNFAISHNSLQNYNIIIQYTLSSAVEVQKGWNLGMVIKNTYKKVQRVKSTSMVNFRRPRKWYKWTFRRTHNRKNIIDRLPFKYTDRKSYIMQQIPPKCFSGKGQIHLKAFANQKLLVLLIEMNVSKKLSV